MGNRLNSTERRKEIKEYLDSVGVLHLNKVELAKKFLVSEKVIRNDIKLLMSDGKPSDVSLILKRFDAAFQHALNQSLKSLSEAQGNREVNDSIRTLIAVIHEHLNSLVKLGYKIDSDKHPPKLTIAQINEIYGIGGRIKIMMPSQSQNITEDIERKPIVSQSGINIPPDDVPDDLVPYNPEKDDMEELTPEELKELEEEDDDECQK